MKKNIVRNSLLAAILLTCFFIWGCSSCSSTKPIINQALLDSQIGWLHGNCFAVKNSDLSPGTKILIVKFAEFGEIPETVTAKIMGKANTEQSCPALSEDRGDVNLWSGASFYFIAPDQEPIDIGLGTAIGIIQLGRDKDNKGILDLNKDGIQDTFDQCYTSEGITFYIWGGEAFKSELIWNAYYYLGYGIESDCSDRLSEIINTSVE